MRRVAAKRRQTPEPRTGLNWAQIDIATRYRQNGDEWKRRSGHFMRGRHASAGAESRCPPRLQSLANWLQALTIQGPSQLLFLCLPGCVGTDNMDRQCSFQARFVLGYLISGDPIELCPPNEIDFRGRKVPASPSTGSVSDTFPIGRSIPPPLLVSCIEPRRIPRVQTFLCYYSCFS
jgi:hypothetical protein